MDEGECSVGTNVCTGGQLMCQGAVSPTTEICDNGLDDDCDSFSDEC